jgi:hypothetical protein
MAMWQEELFPPRVPKSGLIGSAVVDLASIETGCT